MERKIGLLAALLGAQLVAAVVAITWAPSLAPEPGNAHLLALEPAKVDRVTIEAPEGGKVTLARKDGRWVLPDLGDFPADQNKLDNLLTRLGELKRGRVVASSAEALTRLKVADDAFERRLTFFAGNDELARLYLGTAPNLRQSHARTADQKVVHAVAFSTWEAGAEAKDWEDKGILGIPAAEIEGLEVAGLRLRRENGQWQAVEGLAEGEILATGAVDKLATLLAELRFEAVLTGASASDDGLAQPALDLSLTRAGGQVVRYRLGKTGDAYTLTVSTRPERFRLLEFRGRELTEAAARTALVPKPGGEGDAKPITSEQPPASSG